MLTTLRIKNLALVEDLTVEFHPGYNALTGETGAGKSILIGALELVLGQRAERTLIRTGCDACSVEAAFSTAALRPELAGFLDENGLEPCDGAQLLLKRTLTAAGTNRQFVNGSPTTLQILARLGDWLVDIHGPHEHQSLLQPARQLDLLDAFGALGPDRDRFAGLVRQRRDIAARKAGLVVDESTYARQVELLRHQVQEIEAARLQPEEEEALQRDHARAHNAARLLELSQLGLTQLAEDEASLLTLSGSLGRTLQDLQRLDPEAACLVSLHEQATSFFHDLQSDLRRYADRIDLDPARLHELDQRLGILQALKHKYGGAVETVIQFGAEARRSLENLEGREAELARLQAEEHRLDTEIARAGAELSGARRKLLPRLAKAVGAELAALGFRQSRFEVALAPAQPESPPGARIPAATGLDAIDFQFSPNPGEPPRPLRSIASSGEMARVMLAIKTVLAAHDEVPLLIFDEVDANIGGETAHAVGQKMRDIGRQRQVICITHLAPVAAAAPTHFVVNKDVLDGRTLTTVRALGTADRVTELARMLGGQTDAARRHARELLTGTLQDP